MKNNIEQLREKLKWYTYEATYIDYNEQEVNFIIEQLQTYDNEQEDKINSCCIVIPAEQIQVKPKPKKKLNHHVTMAVTSIVAITTSFLLFMSQRTKVIAGLKNGIFNFLTRDESGIEMIIYPEHSTNIKIYDSMEDLPEELESIIWIPKDTLDTYSFSYVTEDEDKIVQRYDNKKLGAYVEVGYILNTGTPDYDGRVTLQIQYGDIAILYYTIDSENSETKYRRTFVYNDINYYIESNSIEDVNIAIYEFIECIMAK